MIYTIPVGTPFVDALAAGILERCGPDPLGLPGWTVLLPTRRACRSLREAFLRRLDGRPLLLPRLFPLGDVDEDELALTSAGDPGGAAAFELPPPIGRLRRQLLLARAIQATGRLAGSHAQAAQLAAELGRLLDELQTEGRDLADLQALVPDDYAAHWQVTLEFLAILREHWPAILADEGASDLKQHQNHRLRALAAAWTARPPDQPVIAAGSTGSIPATADLLKVIARLPQGAVVLPGLDTGSDADSWQAVGETHPQYGLARLLRHLEVDRAAVVPWPVPADIPPASPPVRARLIAEALRPAETTDAWRLLQAGEHPDWSPGLAGVRRVDAPGPREEALAIALAMRETLEQPGRTAALVTPDRALARRVAQALQRWGVAVDDSAGRPLGDTPVGAFLRLLTDAAATPTPVSLLALLKHPLAAGGIAPPEFRRRARDLERAVLRGPRPLLDGAGLRAAVAHAELKGPGARIDRGALAALLDRIESCTGAYLAAAAAGTRLTLSGWLRLHVGAAEALAATDAENGADRLWRGDDGEAGAAFVAELLQSGADGPEMGAADYAGLFGVLVAGPAVRPRHGLHPRLHILGLMETRLQQFDRMILGGLNEGTWPPQPAPDPWLSRPMRRSLGLATPERRIGLTAHDFLMASGAAELLLTRAQRVDGTPTVPSRWLLRLGAVLGASNMPAGVMADDRLLAWAHVLDRPGAPRPCAAPEPRPPVSARPRRLSVTQVETWMRDPYGLYARHVLRLQALEPLDADPGAAERGQFIHDALDRFVRDWPDRLPPDAPDRLRAIGRACFGPMMEHPSVHAFWWPRFERIADWFLATEAARRERRRPLATEVVGELVLEGPAGPFVLHARADRIDRDTVDGRLVLIDYKTGQPPSQPQVEAGFAPQLPLEAAIAAAGGFEGVPPAETAEMAFWRLSGGEPAGEVKALKGDPMQLAAAARDGLEGLIAAFDRPETPYRSQPRPGMAPAYSDYGHLARVAEWSVSGSGEGDE